jgi:TolB-like protein
MLRLAPLMVWSLAAQAQPRVAVMPFKDLAGERASIGEAIAETVTSDLRELPGLRVVERTNIERVLGELDLKARRADLDVPNTIKVGRLLSATLIVVGSFQQAGADMRINARFVETATGEVAGSAKIDGPAADFFKLQDRITAELLKSAKLDLKSFTARRRPKLKSLRAVELYGDSVVESDEQKKKALLHSVLEEAPAFDYAVRDLDALEQRLQQYRAADISADEKIYRDVNQKLEKETNPDQRSLIATQLFSSLFLTQRYRLLVAEARVLFAQSGPPTSNPLTVPVEAQAGYWLVVAQNYLHEDDAALRDGESFLKRFPGSLYYSGVDSTMHQIILRKHNADKGKHDLDDWMAKYGAENQSDTCHLAAVYKGFYQYRDAQRLFRECLSKSPKSRVDTLRELLTCDIECADWKRVREDLRLLEKESSFEYGNFWNWYHAQIPADG